MPGSLYEIIQIGFLNHSSVSIIESENKYKTETNKNLEVYRNLNEVFVEFATRVLSQDNLLTTKNKDYTKFETNGGYSQKVAILDLVSYYRSLDEDKKIYFIKLVLRSLKEGDIKDLYKYIKKEVSATKPDFDIDDFIYCNFKDLALKSSYTEPLLNQIKSHPRIIKLRRKFDI